MPSVPVGGEVEERDVHNVVEMTPENVVEAYGCT